MLYLDASAIVKLVVREAESAALRRALAPHEGLASCALVRTEVVRAARGHGGGAPVRARAVIGRLELVALDEALLDAAGLLGDPVLRTLDAIHLAAARVFGPELEQIVTYDVRMAAAATALGLPVIAPH